MSGFRISMALLLTAAAYSQEVVISGLQAPQRLITTAAGNLLASETSLEPNKGRISLITRAGTRRTFIDGLPSGTDVQGGSSGPTALALRDRTLYIGFGGGDMERPGETPGTSRFNPAGYSSTLFGAILEFQLSAAPDALAGTMTLTAANLSALSAHDPIQIEDGMGNRATVRVLTELPKAMPAPGAIYKFSNLWGLALSDTGDALYVADASMNALYRVETSSGRWVRLLLFPPQPNPGSVGPPVMDAVPTNVRIYGGQILVSFLNGFPFPPGYGRVLVVDPADRSVNPFISGLTSVTDVLHRDRPGQRAQFFALEFSQNQSANPAPPGRLLRFDTPAAQVVASDLRGPVSLAWDESSKSLYVLEISGRILRFPIE